MCKLTNYCRSSSLYIHLVHAITQLSYGLDLSQQWIVSIQKQSLYNFVFCNAYLSEAQLNQLVNYMDTMQSLYNKFNANKVKLKVQNFRPVQCSMGNYDLKKCKDYQMKEQKKNFIYLEQWFHREILDYENLPYQQQNLLQMNWRFVFFPKSVQTSLADGLVKPSFYFNSFNSSLMAVTPSRVQNYGGSSYMNCIPGKHLLNFDPRCRGWYQLAMQNKGITFFSPYLQISSFTIGITISQRFDDADDNNLSVYSFNLDITNLADRYFKDQDTLDQNSLMEGYTVFFHKDTHTIFYHKNWDRSNGILNTWEQVEYNRTLFQFDDSQAQNFQSNLQKIIDEDLDISEINYYFNSSSDSNILYFEKDQNKYIALIIPIKVTSRINAYQSNKLKEQKPFYIGRVHTDISDLIYQANFYFFGIFKKLCIIEVCIILVILLISLIHYFAVLFHIIDMPIQFLCLFLKQFHIRDSGIEKQRVQKANSNFSATRFLSRAFTSHENNSEPQVTQRIQVGSYKKILLAHQIEQQKTFTPQTRQKTITFYEESPKASADQLKSKRNKSFFNFHHDQQSQQRISAFKLKVNEEKNKNGINDAHNGDDKQCQTTPNRVNKLEEVQYLIQSVNEIEQSKLINRQHSQSNATIQNNLGIIFSEVDDKIDQKSINGNDQQELDLKQMDYTFLEMKIIQEAFLQLQQVIQLAKQESSQGNIEASIINFCVVKNIFVKIKNFQQVSFCYYNLGILCIRKGDFLKAVEYLESSIYNNLLSQNYGVNTIQEFAEKLQHINFQKDYNSLQNYQQLSTKICILVYALRNITFQPNCSRKNKSIYLKKGIYYSQICNKMLKTFFHSNLHPSLHINYILLCSLHIDLGFINQAAKYLFKAHKIWNLYKGDTDYDVKTLDQLLLNFEKSFQMQNEDVAFLQLQQNYLKIQNNNNNTVPQDLFIHQVFPQSVIETLKFMNLARIYLKFNKKFEGCQILTRVIEYGQIFDPHTRLEALTYLNENFQNMNLDNLLIQNEIVKYRGDPLNIFIILQCPTSYKDYSNQIKYYLSFIQNLYNNFIHLDDKVQVFQFSDQIVSLNNLSPIQTQNHLYHLLFQIKDHIIQQLNNKFDDSIYDDQTVDYSEVNVINWTQALRHVIYNNIYGKNLLLKSYLQDNFKISKSETTSNQNILDQQKIVNNQKQQDNYDQIQQNSFDQQQSNQEKIEYYSNTRIIIEENLKQINNDHSSILDLQLIQPEYRKRQDIIIIVSDEEEELNNYDSYVNPFQGLPEEFIPTTFHYQRNIFNEQNNFLNQDCSIKNLDKSQNDNTAFQFQFQCENHKYNKHSNFNQFFKDILSYRIFQKQQHF
ncbi:transmembrane protein, putative (macronuclear) [Tetrahymena thermophila SB210]|uniref:Transmembrane protein, putative n=1 Tax=Tetrahymena thermophila (strain SB210) TaxID=312017 RepID=I7LVQ0_TETTS|nr:transmembrane protein, putative [Tetrahymena thermophila SB210]EAR99495.2 transmembrane protein, putative [Tetrahymena thermophila SB210]|eukprot:XP_001019740.2 transmembrane protein, putative [Tetrahymena thermophila SB210]